MILCTVEKKKTTSTTSIQSYKQVRGASICVAINGKTVNKEIVVGLPIAGYFFHGDNRVIEWFKKTKKIRDICNDVKVDKCMK